MEAIKPLNVEKPDIVFPTVQYKRDPVKMMLAAEWRGTTDIRVVERPKPMITDPGDAIIKITSTMICGSDLHFYHNAVSGMSSGQVMGHEFMGYVEAVGPEVKDFKVGDRVVVSAVIACGKCEYCLKEKYSLCDTTNPNKLTEALYGHRLAGVFGYSDLTGGYDGGQAEFARVPIADFNLLKVPSNLRDEQVVYLADTGVTGYHANDLVGTKEGDIVAVWGCGPIGQCAMYWAKFRGAKTIIAIDNNQWRLDFAAQKHGALTINFDKQDVMKTIQQLVPGGPTVCIEAAGFRFLKGVLHKIERGLHLETDQPQTLTEAVRVCRKGERISVIGDYFGYTNHYPIGAQMEKGLIVTGSQVYLQKYWKQILQWIVEGKADLEWLHTHTLPLSKAAEGYALHDSGAPGVLKIILKPSEVVSSV
jgi:threonine dehydrogenase-like Zn-dependent dehydrogenase